MMHVRLRDVKLFNSLTETELSYLEKAGAVVNYNADTNIVIEGETTGGIYFILEGTVAIYKNHKPTKNLIEVGQMRQGDYFGEISLIDNQPRSATVRTQTPVRAYNVTREAFLNFLNSSAELRIRFLEGCIRDFIGRLRTLDEEFLQNKYLLWSKALTKPKSTKEAS